MKLYILLEILLGTSLCFFICYYQSIIVSKPLSSFHCYENNDCPLCTLNGHVFISQCIDQICDLCTTDITPLPLT